MLEKQWWYQYAGEAHGPYDNRERAARAFFDTGAKARDVMTGYGSTGPSFDIRWVTREQAYKTN